MYILGISAFYHDSAACIIKDGVIIAAAEEERFSRIKHDNSFPHKAIDACLKKAGVKILDIEYIAYYEKPLLKFERILVNFINTFPRSLIMFIKSMPEWLGTKIKVKYIIEKNLNYDGKIYFIPHHLSHAAAAYFTSGLDSSAVLTMDGVGEYQTTALWMAKGGNIKLLKHIDFPDSLGLLYSTFTAFCGFEVNEGEYKLMGMAAYGKPKYENQIKKIIDIKSDGSFRLNMKYFGFQNGAKMWSGKFESLFGKPRLPGDKISQRHKDLASSIQGITEKIYFKTANHLAELTKSNNLCIGGGVGLNALANGKLYGNTSFKKIHIFGPSGDSGGAIGAALFTYHSILKKPGKHKNYTLTLGTEYSGSEIEATLKINRLSYKKFKNEADLIEASAKLLSQNKILGWFQAAMEFGPRALGARSILANPKEKSMKEKVNKIKIREEFRPFAGIILRDRAQELFEVPEKKHRSPFMNFCFKVKTEKVNEIASIVHTDKTCRIQTVDKSNGRIYALLTEFYNQTKTPCLLNTSFNLKGEPIVENPKQAIDDFIKTPMDYLVIGDFIVSKSSRS